jgi:four helix bundle protein
MRTDKKNNVILKLTFDFSIKIIKYAETLESERRFVIARQVIRSGTAIGALAREAQNAESVSDFIHKFKIAAKEMDETEYWLELCEVSYGHQQAVELRKFLEEISRIITKIISSSKSKLKTTG